MREIIDSTNTSSKKEAKKAEYVAKKWIFVDNEDFTATCLEAGIEPYVVRKVAIGFIKRQRNKSNLRDIDIKLIMSQLIKENLFCNKNLKLS